MSEKLVRRLCVLAALALAISPAFAQSTAPTSLAQTSWRAETIGDRKTLPYVASTLNFGADDNVSGDSGCNRYFASIEITDNALKFGPIGATRMACEAAVNQQEIQFLEALDAARTYQIDDGDLVLADEDGRPVVRLSPLD